MRKGDSMWSGDRGTAFAMEDGQSAVRGGSAADLLPSGRNGFVRAILLSGIALAHMLPQLVRRPRSSSQDRSATSEKNKNRKGARGAREKANELIFPLRPSRPCGFSRILGGT